MKLTAGRFIVFNDTNAVVGANVIITTWRNQTFLISQFIARVTTVAMISDDSSVARAIFDDWTGNLGNAAPVQARANPGFRAGRIRIQMSFKNNV